MPRHFDEMRVLRANVSSGTPNQLVHGGATYASKVNRQQVADGAAILGDIVPLVSSLMLDEHTLDYGAIDYPVLPSA